MHLRRHGSWSLDDDDDGPTGSSLDDERADDRGGCNQPRRSPSAFDADDDDGEMDDCQKWWRCHALHACDEWTGRALNLFRELFVQHRRLKQLPLSCSPDRDVAGNRGVNMSQVGCSGDPYDHMLQPLHSDKTTRTCHWSWSRTTWSRPLAQLNPFVVGQQPRQTSPGAAGRAAVVKMLEW